MEQCSPSVYHLAGTCIWRWPVTSCLPPLLYFLALLSHFTLFCNVRRKVDDGLGTGEPKMRENN